MIDGPTDVLAEHVMCDLTGWKALFCDCKSGPRVLVQHLKSSTLLFRWIEGIIEILQIWI